MDVTPLLSPSGGESLSSRSLCSLPLNLLNAYLLTRSFLAQTTYRFLVEIGARFAFPISKKFYFLQLLLGKFLPKFYRIMMFEITEV